jgi:hypothetical protein
MTLISIFSSDHVDHDDKPAPQRHGLFAFVTLVDGTADRSISIFCPAGTLNMPMTRSPASAGIITVLCLVLAAAISVLVVVTVNYRRGRRPRPIHATCHDAGDCSGHGQCTDGRCVCSKGYTGTHCQTASTATCHTTDDCSNHGTCTEGQCVCDHGFSGNHCETKAMSCHHDTDCGHGTCTQGKCVCHAGFKGIKCNMLTCDKRKCANGTGCMCKTGKCICSIGFHADATGYCVSNGQAGCTKKSECIGSVNKQCKLSGGHGTCVECLVNADCTDVAKPTCSSDNLCVTGGQPSASSDSDVTYLVSMHDPTTGQVVSSTNDWLNTQIKASKTGDVIFLWTDYMNLDDSIQNLKDAVQAGATVCLGVDRIQVCSNASSGGNQGSTQTTTCESLGTVDCDGEKGGGNCFLPGVGGCRNMNSYIGALAPVASAVYATKQATSCPRPGGSKTAGALYALDYPTPPDLSNDSAYHSHRKIIHFYRTGGRKSSFFKGSWNIAAPGQSGQNNGLAECGVGVTTATQGDLMQYLLKMDISMLDAYIFSQPSIKSTQPFRTLLSDLQVARYKPDGKFPTLPIVATMKWQGAKFGATSAASGTVKNVSFLFGMSPSPKDQPLTVAAGGFDSSIKYTYTKSTYAKPTSSGDPGTSYDDTMAIQQPGFKENVWTPLNAITNYTFANVSGTQKQAWAAGCAWNGTMVQRVLQKAKKKKLTMKIAMYEPALDASFPPKGLTSQNGTCAVGSTGVCDNQRFQWDWSILSEIIDFISTGKLSVMTGQFQEPGDFPPRNDNSLPLVGLINYNTTLNKYKDNMFYRAYLIACQDGKCTGKTTWPLAHGCNGLGSNYDHYWKTTVCTPDAAQGLGVQVLCCKSHWKMYLSAEDVDFSSGHWSNGYYSTATWFNDDFLIQDGGGLIDYLNNVYDDVYANNAISLNNETDKSKNPQWNPPEGAEYDALKAGLFCTPPGTDANPCKVGPGQGPTSYPTYKALQTAKPDIWAANSTDYTSEWGFENPW